MANLKDQNFVSKHSKWVCNIYIYHSKKQLGLENDNHDSDTESDPEAEVEDEMGVDNLPEVVVEQSIVTIIKTLISQLDLIRPDDIRFYHREHLQP